MPGIDGLKATRRIVANDERADTRVIVLTTFERDEYVFEALRIGASGFLLKDTAPPALLSALRTVADGGALLSHSVTRTLISEYLSSRQRPVTPHPQLDQLTEREREVVALVAEDLSSQEIAERLVISPDPRQPGDDQARRPRPRPTGGVRLPVRAGLSVVAAYTRPAQERGRSVTDPLAPPVQSVTAAGAAARPDPSSLGVRGLPGGSRPRRDNQRSGGSLFCCKGLWRSW